MELLEVLDEKGRLTGAIIDKDEIHKKGLYHHEVALFLVNSKCEILLQKRDVTKDTQPGKWAWHGGHVQAKEKIESAIIRETKEELGIDIEERNLKILTEIKHEKMPNRQFTTVFICRSDLKSEDFVIEKNELSQVEWFMIDEIENMIYGEHPDMMFKNNANTHAILNSLKTYLNYMTFPIDEIETLKKRLNLGQSIYTIRVSHEVDKYKPGQTYNTVQGPLLVKSRIHISTLRTSVLQ